MILRQIKRLPAKALVVAILASAAAFALMLNDARQPSSVIDANPAFGTVKPNPTSGFVIENHLLHLPVRFTTCTTTSATCKLGAYAVKLQYDTSKLATADVAGSSSGGNTSTTLKDTTKNWRPLEWVGARVRLAGGAGSIGANGNNQSRVVTSNTNNTLTVSPAWDGSVPLPNTTTFYELGGMQDGGWLGSTNRAMSCPVGSTFGSNWAELHCITLDDQPQGPTGAGDLTMTSFATLGRGLVQFTLVNPDTKVLKIDGFQIDADIVNGARRIVRCPDPDGNNQVNVVDLLLVSQANGSTAPGPPYTTSRDPDESGAVNVIDLQITAALNAKKCVL